MNLAVTAVAQDSEPDCASAAEMRFYTARGTARKGALNRENVASLHRSERGWRRTSHDCGTPLELTAVVTIRR